MVRRISLFSFDAVHGYNNKTSNTNSEDARAYLTWFNWIFFFVLFFYAVAMCFVHSSSNSLFIKNKIPTINFLWKWDKHTQKKKTKRCAQNPRRDFAVEKCWYWQGENSRNNPSIGLLCESARCPLHAFGPVQPVHWNSSSLHVYSITISVMQSFLIYAK